MGETIRALFQPVIDLFTPKADQPPPQVGGYKVDYSPVSPEDIAAPIEGDRLFETGNWVPINRKS
jgi:hypothetical protein